MNEKTAPAGNIIVRAMRLLTESADELRQGISICDTPDWANEPDTKTVYDEHLAVVAGLRGLAGWNSADRALQVSDVVVEDIAETSRPFTGKFHGETDRDRDERISKFYEDERSEAGSHKPQQIASPAVGDDDAAESVNDTNAILATQYFEVLKKLEAYEKNGVTCQTFRHFVDVPCDECNAVVGPAAGDVAMPQVGDHCGRATDANARMLEMANLIAASACPEEESRLEVAYAIARHLRLDWPAARVLRASPAMGDDDVLEYCDTHPGSSFFDAVVALGGFNNAQTALATKDAEIAALTAERKLICEAIEGAMAAGYEGSTPPPEPTHWLIPFWEIGQYKASLEDRVEELEAAAPAGAQPVQPASDSKDAEITALTAERDALRSDALRAAAVAFGLMAADHPNELPTDAAELAEWLDVHAFPLLPDDMGPEGLFIHIIRAAMTKDPK